MGQSPFSGNPQTSQAKPHALGIFITSFLVINLVSVYLPANFG